MPLQVRNFERILRENLIWLRRYDILKITKFLKIVAKWQNIRNSQLYNFFNQLSFTNNFFTLKLCHKSKTIFCCQSYKVIFAPTTVKSKNQKTYDCWKYEVLLSWKVSAQTDKNWNTSLKEISFWWQLTRECSFKIFLRFSWAIDSEPIRARGIIVK